MKKQILVLSAFLISLMSYYVGKKSGEDAMEVDLTRDLPNETKAELEALAPWMMEARAFYFGDYMVYVPNTEKPSKMMVTYGNRIVMLEPHSIGYNEGPSLNGFMMIDTNESGIFDHVSYDTIDKNGKVIAHVLDFNRDGQPDLRGPYYDDIKLPPQIRLGDIWTDLIERGEQIGVLIGDEFKPVERRKDGYGYKSSSNK
ncbi:MAG: hypothetical protein N0C84_16395 [Candidatus Thiodiazotropha taylori]|uniref:WG repeat-containing protein n=1 Tax=Candidatus Thiodiazotropha taylori TaxID=2792791 RepID=A0A9E4N5K7_9GAMM|nr:hypothetical protein [Candidatus Thiodiazotropha taylori]MCW4258044.1 hypothetical protein [Candidatus Thiodiazotropha taylori]